MTIVRCPRCRDEVTVPAKASGRALVRCPLCLEEYLLAEALANAPPALVIIGGEIPQTEVALVAEDEEYQLSAATFTPAVPAPMTVGQAARPAVRPIVRLRKREKSGFALAVAYVGGGVLGLALGMLVLWWIIRRDPLQAGPPVAEYAPWIVPAQFHGKVEPIHEETVRPAIKISRPDDSDRTEKAERHQPSKKAGKQPLEDLPNVEPPVSERGDTVPRDDDPAPRAPPAPDLIGLLPDDWPIAVVEPPRRRSLVSTEELHEAVISTGAALRRYSALPATAGDARAEAVVDFHGAAGEVGRLLSYRESGDSELIEELNAFEKILGEAATKSALMTGLELQTAERWPDVPDGYGLLAAGIVKAIAPAGSVFAITLEAGGREQRVSLFITSLNDPKDVCAIGGRVLAAGRIVEEPKVNLPGYEGEQKKVLAAGSLWALPKSQ